MFERLASAGRVAWGILGIGAVVAVVGYVLWQFRVIFPTVVLAGAIVFILNPIVTWLHVHRIPRLGGTALSYLGVIGLFVGVGFLIAPVITSQAEEFADQWPELRADLEDWLDDVSERSKEGNWPVEIPNSEELIDQLGGTSNADLDDFDMVVREARDSLEADHPVVAADLDRVAANMRTNLDDGGGLVGQFETVRDIGARIFQVGLIFIVGPVVAFYLLMDLPRVSKILDSLIPAPAKDQVHHVGGRVSQTLGGFFRGQLLIAFIVGVLISLGLWIIDLPFWLLVGMIAGASNVVPLIGPWVGAVPGVIIALTTRDLTTAIWVGVIMAAVQQLESSFLSPLVMHRTTRLHPAVVLLALLLGGTLGGFFGLLISVPLTGALKVIGGHLWKVYILNTPPEEVMAATRPPPEETSQQEGIRGAVSHYVAGEIGPRMRDESELSLGSDDGDSIVDAGPRPDRDGLDDADSSPAEDRASPEGDDEGRPGRRADDGSADDA